MFVIKLRGIDSARGMCVRALVGVSLCVGACVCVFMILLKLRDVGSAH